MGSRGQAAFFIALSVTAAFLIFGFAARDPALRAAQLHSPACFSRSPAREYSFLPSWLNQLLCTYNRIFLAQTGTPQANALTNIFSRVQYTSSAILAYESFRQPGFGARRALWWLLLSQVTSIGATLPLYFALAATRKAGVVRTTIMPHEAWTVFIALLVGYIGPSFFVTYQGWSYDSLSIWQAYPLYMIGLTIILPPVLRAFTASPSSALGEKQTRFAIIAIATVGVLLSCHSHFKFLGSGIDFRDVIHIFPQKPQVPADSITPAAHLIFLFDMLASFIAGCAHVVLSFFGEDAERKLGYGIVLVALTNFIGPGGALAAVWAIRETYGITVARKASAQAQTKKTI